MKIKLCPFCAHEPIVYEGVDPCGFYCDYVYCSHCMENGDGYNSIRLDVWQNRLTTPEPIDKEEEQ